MKSLLTVLFNLLSIACNALIKLTELTVLLSDETNNWFVVWDNANVGWWTIKLSFHLYN